MRQTKLALSQITNEAAQHFTKRIIDDWKQLVEELQEASKTRNIPLPESVRLDKAHNILADAQQKQNADIADNEMPIALGA